MAEGRLYTQEEVKAIGDELHHIKEIEKDQKKNALIADLENHISGYLTAGGDIQAVAEIVQQVIDLHKKKRGLS